MKAILLHHSSLVSLLCGPTWNPGTCEFPWASRGSCKVCLWGQIVSPYQEWGPAWVQFLCIFYSGGTPT